MKQHQHHYCTGEDLANEEEETAAAATEGNIRDAAVRQLFLRAAIAAIIALWPARRVVIIVQDH